MIAMIAILTIKRLYVLYKCITFALYKLTIVWQHHLLYANRHRSDSARN